MNIKINTLEKFLREVMSAYLGRQAPPPQRNDNLAPEYIAEIASGGTPSLTDARPREVVSPLARRIPMTTSCDSSAHKKETKVFKSLLNSMPSDGVYCITRSERHSIDLDVLKAELVDLLHRLLQYIRTLITITNLQAAS